MALDEEINCLQLQREDRKVENFWQLGKVAWKWLEKNSKEEGLSLKLMQKYQC